MIDSGQVEQIDVLPDDVLLEIFDFYTTIMSLHTWTGCPLRCEKKRIDAWQTLVHVCRRWRSLVFISPRRLHLGLCCTPETPVRDKLDVWPALPLIVFGNMTSSGADNIIAALERSNRVCEVNLQLGGRQLEQVLAAMQVPFPELTDLHLFSEDETLPVIPDSSLDGSAPRLRTVNLSGIPFPGLPNLLLSATQLVSLQLTDVPDSGYFSSEAMVALISVLSRLESFSLEFRSPQSRPDRETQRPPPSKRSILPDLYEFGFKGDTEYLEDFVTCIDAPGLHRLIISFFDQIDCGCPRLYQFINRIPTFTALKEVHVQFGDGTASFIHRHWMSDTYDRDDNLQIYFSCTEPERQLSAIEQVCNSLSSPLSTAKKLYIEHEYSQLIWEDHDIEDTLWLRLLLPFAAVEELLLSKEFVPDIAAALKELVRERIVQVLPLLMILP